MRIRKETLVFSIFFIAVLTVSAAFVVASSRFGITFGEYLIKADSYTKSLSDEQILNIVKESELTSEQQRLLSKLTDGQIVAIARGTEAGKKFSDFT